LLAPLFLTSSGLMLPFDVWPAPRLLMASPNVMASGSFTSTIC